MKVYCYNENYIFTNIEDAPINPLEGGFIFPTNSTTKEVDLSLIDEKHYYYFNVGINEWELKEIVEPPAPIEPEKTFTDVKQAKIDEINFIYEQKASLVKINTPISEISTWYIQELEATEWSKDNTKNTPFIDGLATARNVDRLTLIDKILTKVNAYKTFMGNLTGQRQFYEDLINKATTKEEVEQITWS